MLVKKTLATVATASVLSFGMIAPASAATNVNRQAGAAAGVVAAVVNANIQDVRVEVVEVGDVNVTLTRVLNNNRVLTDFLNNNNILNDNVVTVTDVVDVTIEGNTLVVNVLGTSTLA